MGRMNKTIGLLVFTLFTTAAFASSCPEACVCTTSIDGLHHATCSDLLKLQKFTLREKHHNINILDLSHNNITKVNHELDKLTEVVSLDLSTNGITEINNFLISSKKLVHINLANNRIEELQLEYLPKSVSSLDLKNNLLQNVPSNLKHLASLEHLLLNGNPLDCSCKNIMLRDELLTAKVVIDNVFCVSPSKLNNYSWLELKTKDICKYTKKNSYLDMMMGDQPINATLIENEASDLNPKHSSGSVLDETNVIQSEGVTEADDKKIFLQYESPTALDGVDDNSDSTTIESVQLLNSNNLQQNDNVHLIDNFEDTTEITDDAQVTISSTENTNVSENVEETTEMGDDGSGSGLGLWESIEDIGKTSVDDTTLAVTDKYEDLEPGKVHRYFEEDSDSTTPEYATPLPPTIYAGGPNWRNNSDPIPEDVSDNIIEDEVTSKAPEITNEIVPASAIPEIFITTQSARDTTVHQPIIITPEVKLSASVADEKPAPHKTGTYVCVALIVVLLVGLIGFAIVKNQLRKKRDKRLLRQQKPDIEKASKEMVDMNKSLLGKPASSDLPIERNGNGNGKYKLVPTHETYQKKNENGNIGNGFKQGENNGKNNSPRDSNQNKNSSKDNNLLNENVQHDTSFDSKNDDNSMSSEDIFERINDEDTPKENCTLDMSQLLLNGDQNSDSQFRSPSREYVPVYSPDMGRVRIKLSETPKPKTPVLVTRCRSNAGDIIITPTVENNVRKSTT